MPTTKADNHLQDMNYFFRLKNESNSPLFSKEQLFNEVRELRARIDNLLFDECGEFVGTIAKIFPITSRAFWPSTFINCIDCGCVINELTSDKNKGFCDAHFSNKKRDAQDEQIMDFTEAKFFRLKNESNSQLFSKEQLFDEVRELRARVDASLFDEYGEFVGTIAKIFPITSRAFWPSAFINCIDCGCDINKYTSDKNEGFCDTHVPVKSQENKRNKTEKYFEKYFTSKDPFRGRIWSPFDGRPSI
jgi:hypothetical protein